MRYPFSFAVAHVAVLGLVVGILLMDGCAHRKPSSSLKIPNGPASTPAKGVRP
jgi:hypothetical protein